MIDKIEKCPYCNVKPKFKLTKFYSQHSYTHDMEKRWMVECPKCKKGFVLYSFMGIQPTKKSAIKRWNEMVIKNTL